MQITELPPAPCQIPVLEQFKTRKFNLELSGYELLALSIISQKIAGGGKFRSVFSRGTDDTEGFYDKIDRIEGVRQAETELRKTLTFGENSNRDTGTYIVVKG